MEIVKAAEALSRGAAAASRLRVSGLDQGDRVAFAVPAGGLTGSSLEQAAQLQAATTIAAFGALGAGMVPVMVNPELGPIERAQVLSDCRANRVISSAAEMLALADPEGAPRRSDLADLPQARPMHYTSGTTGRAKGVWTGMLPGPVAELWWRDEIEQWPHEPSDISLVHGPVAHFGPLRFAMLSWLGGGSAVFPGRFDAPRMARIMTELRPTTAFVVPGHLQRLFALPGGPPPSPYRRLVHAGAACPESLKRTAHRWAGVHRVWEFYGSTEGQFTACSGPEWEERPGTVGRSRARRRLLIDNGVIWCHGPEYCRFEYFDDPERTAAAWREDAGSAGVGAAFTVGDLGRLDADGYLWLEGRREDLIITGGVNVYPAQVESVLARLPGVDEIAVFGVVDAVWGQRVCAAFVGSADPDAVRDWARSNLAPHQVPKLIRRLPELPRTASGKIRRVNLADLFT